MRFFSLARHTNLNMAVFGLTFQIGFKSNKNVPVIANLIVCYRK